MFDIGFSELVLIAVVALVVLGPERLPKVARTMGHLLGRLQRYVSDVKSDISREIQLDELRKLQTQLEESARKAEATVREEMVNTEAQLRSVAVGAIAPAVKGDAEPIAVAPPQSDTEPAEMQPAAASPQLELGLETTLPGHGDQRA
jgi:sec-independent protein translocase protein TatB